MTDTALTELVISWLWLIAVCWLLLRAYRQSKLFTRLAPTRQVLGRNPDVAVVIPARNESANIARCALSILNQSYPAGCLRVIVVDDNSTDDTAAIAHSISKQRQELEVLHSPPLPAGWIGKSHACWFGSRQVSPHADWLCFIDADVWSEPELIATAVQYAAAERIDLLSLTPRHELKTFAERLLLPCGHYVLAFCQDLRSVNDPRSEAAPVTGQFMLVRRQSYEAVGGHAAVSSAICEDVALAQAVKRAGYQVILKSGEQLIATRMYTGWRSLWVGLTKNLVDMLGGARRAASIATCAVLLSWLAITLPVVEIISCAGQMWRCPALIPALLGSAATFGFHIGGAAHFRIPLWYGLLFPVGYTVGAVLAIDSIWRRWRGRLTWKDRVYP